MKITTDGKNKIIVVLLSLPYILWLIFGVSKFIVGRAIYESDNPTEVIKQIHIDINQEVIT